MGSEAQGQNKFEEFLSRIELSNLSELHGKVIFVCWRDAHHDHISDWTSIEDIEFPNTIIHSVGFLVKEDDNHIMIASSMAFKTQDKEEESDMVCGFFTITKNQIIGIKRIEGNEDSD